ncbi:MAG TPA: phenylalanine--tRNA ligase subunit beta [Lentisphaeria bacterium]|nr:MAG: phenylalanine--tRNA ligase subunit beta [Lentisphaerae bacterium GWF2_38_69]HBM14988.1 phenylalanine--tRNA ligase subunit beta [Lentisphaeria bacterium]
MKISYNWLSRYIDIPYSPEELVERLTMVGVEVESFLKINIIPDQIVVGEILERNKHPNADKLSVCKVTNGKEILQIVCGAPNCDEGKKVPLAQIGTVFKNSDGSDFKIKEAKLRGVESFGMLCSSKELGISLESSGLMELDAKLDVGRPINQIFTPDTVYELEITSNRPDWNSFISIAREIRALSGNEIKYPAIHLENSPVSSTPSVKIDDYDGCPKYTARIIRDVKIDQSPKWLKDALISIGLRPINNIVDITNFVLFETGQPLHAFDLDRLEGGCIKVRRAYDGERIVAIDEKTYELKTDYLVISDASKPQAIAGVMGGIDSGITNETVNVLLESAYFNPQIVKKASRELSLFSASSYRFERGVDCQMVNKASDRAASLILELAGGRIDSELGIISDETKLPKPFVVRCSFKRIRNLIGVDITDEKMIDILRKLDLIVENINDDSFEVSGRTFRLDIEREADVAEEISRIYGLDKIISSDINLKIVSSFKNDTYQYIETIRNNMISLGLTECLNYTLIDKKTVTKDGFYAEENLLEVINPISSENSILRPSLFFGIFKSLIRNVSYNNHDLSLFEIGKTYSADKSRNEESYSSFILLSGRRHPEMYSEEKKEIYELFDIKGLVESLMDSLQIKSYSVHSIQSKLFKVGTAIQYMIGNDILLTLGEIADSFTKGMRIRYPVYGAQIELDKIVEIMKNRSVIRYQPTPVYPSTTRDIALCCDENMENATIIDCIKSVKNEIIENVELFDLYHDKSLGSRKKSMAYSITYRSSDRTLTDDEVNKTQEKIRSELVSKLSVELR